MPEIFEVTVRSGEDICKTISDFVTAHGWQNVMIPAAIGSVIGMEFTAPIRDELPLRCAVTPYHAAAELLSFTGEIMKRECADPALLEVYPDKVSPLIVHIHASCATAGGHVAGGGLRAGKAFRSVRMDRNYDRRNQERWQNVLYFAVVSFSVVGIAIGSPIAIKNVHRLLSAV